MVSAITLIPRIVSKISKSKTLAVQSEILALGLLKGYSFSNIKFLIRQFRLETAHGTSNVYESFYNAFGMGCVQVRQHLQSGCYVAPNGENIGIYKNVSDSIACRFLWDDYFGFDTDKHTLMYSPNVASKYHESPDYLRRVDAVRITNWNATLFLTMLSLPIEAYILYRLWNFSKG